MIQTGEKAVLVQQEDKFDFFVDLWLYHYKFRDIIYVLRYFVILEEKCLLKILVLT